MWCRRPNSRKAHVSSPKTDKTLLATPPWRQVFRPAALHTLKQPSHACDVTPPGSKRQLNHPVAEYRLTTHERTNRVSSDCSHTILARTPRRPSRRHPALAYPQVYAYLLDNKTRDEMRQERRRSPLWWLARLRCYQRKLCPERQRA
jgi:hypothetical protein